MLLKQKGNSVLQKPDLLFFGHIPSILLLPAALSHFSKQYTGTTLVFLKSLYFIRFGRHTLLSAVIIMIVTADADIQRT